MPNIEVPILPDSVTDVRISAIHVQEGDFVELGEQLFDIETNKVVLEITAVDFGVIEELSVSLSDQVESKQVIGFLVPEPEGSEKRKLAQVQALDHSSIDRASYSGESSKPPFLGWLFVVLMIGVAITALLS